MRLRHRTSEERRGKKGEKGHGEKATCSVKMKGGNSEGKAPFGGECGCVGGGVWGGGGVGGIGGVSR